jgi:thermitase
MKFTFRLRGKPVTVAAIETLAAVRPTEKLRSSLTKSRLVARFGGAAPDDAAGGKAGLVLPARNRRLFEAAGWTFVEASRPVSDAAIERTAIEGAEAVRRVYLGRSGTLIGTGLVTLGVEPGRPESEVRDRLKADGLRLVRRLRFVEGVYEARITSRRPELDVVQELQERAAYRFIEPVFLEAMTGRWTPSDPHFGDQWQHANDGSNGGVAGADIHSVPAWDLARGAGVRIAVVDNGFQVTHPDLKDGVIRGGFFESDNTGTATFRPWKPGQAGFPNGFHGTFCLGMAGARANNGKGGCGSAPEADLIPIACFPDQIGTQETLASAIGYAADPSSLDAKARAADGAHVIACSLGPNGADWDMSSVLDLVIQRAAGTGRGGLGIPIFWAATNGPFDIASDEVCSHPDVLAISRSNRNDLEDGAGFGPKLEFLAPGVEVFSTQSGGRYGTSTGCSFAAPLAAGVAALILQRHPDWTRDQVRDRLRSSCDKVGGVAYGADGRHDEYGFGRLNAEAAVQ